MKKLLILLFFANTVLCHAQDEQSDWHRTNPDVLVYKPKGGDSHDGDNEHFLVFPSYRGDELLAIWNQGSVESFGDNRVMFTRSSDGTNWATPIKLTGATPGVKGMQSSWPFPIIARKTGRIYVFFLKQGTLTDGNPAGCGTMGCLTSDDNGHSWKDQPDIPMPRNQFSNPDPAVPNNWIVWQKPIRDASGRPLAGYTQVVSPSLMPAAIKKHWYQWSSYCEFMRFDNIDEGPDSQELKLTWLPKDPENIQVMHPNTGFSSCSEPSIVLLPDGRLFSTMRTYTGAIWYSVSSNGGADWSRPEIMRYQDDGNPVEHPLSPCPIYALADGRFLLLYHNNPGRIGEYNQLQNNWKTNQLLFLRSPTYIAVGKYRPEARQPIWFSQPKKILDTSGVSIGPKHSSEVGTYTSLTEWKGKRVLWYPDRKFYLLGKHLPDELLADMKVPEMTTHPAANEPSATVPALQTNKPSIPLRWINPTDKDVSVEGLPWFSENGGSLSRLPVKDKNSFRLPVWILSQSPSGGRIRFKTDSQILSLKLEYPGGPNMANMHAFGQTGVDVYVDGTCLFTATAGKDAQPLRTSEAIAFDFSNQPRQERDITLYLPLYKSVKIHGIGVDTSAVVKLPEAHKTALPVVFYGTSVTQGGVASRPGMSYPALLSRKLDFDFVNLGFSGNGLGEPEVAKAVSAINASCFVLDFGGNHTNFEDMKKVYRPFIEAIRSQHPQTPILALSPIYTTREARFETFKQDWNQRREFIHNIVTELQRSGDLHIEYVDGLDLLGPSRADGLTDGSHPNDLGFYWMAEELAPRLQKVLKH